MKTGDELDAVSRVCRCVLIFLGRAGVTRRIKVGMARRARREAKRELRDATTAPGE